MSAINLHYPKMKVFQLLSTQVASGAKVYTYEAGTSTDKATYSDQGLTTANANPVICDSNGEAQVWLLDDGLYKIVITDSDDVAISTVDNVGSAVAATGTDGYANLVPNGSMETNTGDNGIPTGWALSITGTSTIQIDQSDVFHGDSCLEFIGGASGAGTATSGFFEVQPNKEIPTRLSLKASAATVGQTVKLLWYQDDQTASGVTTSDTIYSASTDAPTSWEEKLVFATSPTDAKYAKIQVAGSTDAGTTRYDDISVFEKPVIMQVLGADIASATALPINIIGDYHDVTGTTAITSFVTYRVGAVKRLQFDGVLTLTHHATNLILPSGEDITTAAGDVGEFVEYGSGTWRCINYAPATGNPVYTREGTWVQIEAPTVISSSPSTVDFDDIFSSTYDVYKIVLASVGVTTNTDKLWLRVGTGTGPVSYDSAANYDHHMSTCTSSVGTYSAAIANAATEIVLTSSTLVDEGVSGELTIYNPASTAQFTSITANVSYINSAAVAGTSVGTGIYQADTALTGIQLLASTGTMKAGTIYIYGLQI